MRRSLRQGLAPVFALAALAGLTTEARAQFGFGSYPSGYGNYGWGGWGSDTAQGDIARGLGSYNIGAGIYNEDTAVANSINTNTVMRWNEYMFLSQEEANRREALRRTATEKREKKDYDQIHKRIVENPSPEDITDGNALNAALDQLSNPRIHSSALRQADVKIPGRVIRELPFVNASEAVAISLNGLTAADGWPGALNGARFADDRKAYSAAVQKALQEDEQGEIAPATIQEARAALSKIRAKLEANPPSDRASFGEAETHLRALYGMTRMLERPDVDKVLAELDSVKETTLGSLLGFMHTFNLRFGRATTGPQRAAYEALFPLVDEHRDKILGKAPKDTETAKASDNAGRPTDFFKGLNYGHLEGPRREGKPAPKEDQ